MFLITIKDDNTIVGIGEKISYLTNGYPKLVDENIAFPDWMVNICNLNEIPNHVTVDKYCYTIEDGFYENPNYNEPNNSFGISNELYDAIIDEYTMQLIEEGAF